MLLGIFGTSSEYKDAFESSVRITIHHSEGNGWDKYLINKMRKFEFCRTLKTYKLKHQLKIVIYLFFVVIVKESEVVKQLFILIKKLKMNETTFIANFDRDNSFEIKFLYQVYICLQQFLSSCSNVSYM